MQKTRKHRLSEYEGENCTLESLKTFVEKFSSGVYLLFYNLERVIIFYNLLKILRFKNITYKLFF